MVSGEASNKQQAKRCKAKHKKSKQPWKQRSNVYEVGAGGRGLRGGVEFGVSVNFRF